MSVTHTLQPLHSLKPLFEGSKTLARVKSLAEQFAVPLYLVGGAVRDALLSGTLSKDLDVVVPPEQAQAIAESLAKALEGKCICLDPHYQIYRVFVFDDVEMVDVAGCIGPDIHADLLRRDYTINALGYDVFTGELLDPTGGLTDMETGTLRMISEANMLDDPLRMLRAFRIGAELQFTYITDETLDVIQTHGQKVLTSAIERIHYELMRLYSAPKCFTHVRLMADTGLLEHLYPELIPCHEVPANQFHHLKLFDHTLELLNQAEIHFPDLPPAVQEHLMGWVNPFTRRLAWVRLACLFHDIGKPDTMDYDAENNKYKFYGHEEVSETMTHGIAERFKWGKETTTRVCHLVRWHLYPEAVMRPEVTEKAHRKFFRRIDDVLPEMMLLAVADRFSAQGPAINQSDLADSKTRLLALWEMFEAFNTVEKSKQKLLSGKEIMHLLRIEPGPKVGDILNELSEAYLNGELSTAEEARTWLLAHYTSSTGKLG